MVSQKQIKTMVKYSTFIIILLFAFGTLHAQQSGGGSVFYEKFRTLKFSEREDLVYNEAKSGNTPNFFKQFVKIESVERDSSGELRRVTLFVSPNYLAIGDDNDYFIVPVGPYTAQKTAEIFDSSLPTPKVVDIIYRESRIKLEPFYFIPRGDRNETPDILYDHSKIVQAQMKAAGALPSALVAGTKKDIVISSKLDDSLRTHHVTIYGWHRLNGTPIQPVTNIHIDTYVDYSHGARFISNRVLIDGVEHNYRDILRDERLHKLISYEERPLKKISY